MNKEEIEQDNYFIEEDLENPYCEICGTCGYIGCCGIRDFIEYHIEGKTNCKNEDGIISDLISLCEYKDIVFEENEELQQENEQLKKENELLQHYKTLYQDIKGRKDKAVKELKDLLSYAYIMDGKYIRYDYATGDLLNLLEILEGTKDEI